MGTVNGGGRWEEKKKKKRGKKTEKEGENYIVVEKINIYCILFFSIPVLLQLLQNAYKMKAYLTGTQ